VTGTELARDGELSIRTMCGKAAEYELLVAWRAQPHVSEWWDTDGPPFTFELARDSYGPEAEDQNTTYCFVEHDGRPIGFIQFFRWQDYAEEAREIGIPDIAEASSLDVFIGEPDALGIGLGSRAVDLLCRFLFEKGASTVALATALDNVRAHRAFQKAGFRKIERVLDSDTRQGERIASWLMVRERSVPFEP
jgi:aminoglycoside 6'-N-acetyltransferase